MKSNFKVGDKVRVISNDIQPKFEGSIGTVKKVYETFMCEEVTHVYRIEVNGSVLRGVATDGDLEAV